jgi:protease IV
MKPTDLISSRFPTKPGQPLLLELDLTRGLLETPSATPVAAARTRHVPVLGQLVQALRKAAEDDNVAGLIAHAGGKQPTLAQSSEIRTAVAAFQSSGKPTICWSESYGELGPGNISYHLASAFKEVWLQPTGDVGLIGVVGQALFVHDALERLGIATQMGQRHEYKTAANMFLESTLTGPHREMLERIVESSTDTIVADVAAARGLTPAAVRDALDLAPLTAEEAKTRGLVDRLGYRDEVYAEARQRLGDVQLRYLTRYGRSIGERAAQALHPAGVVRRSKPVVAVVQAVGGIHVGRSNTSPLGGRSVGSDSFGAALRSVADDDNVKAVVVRVDSPGGSYVASDAIRREMLQLRRTGRPVIASMASIAGSGGYYIAMPGDAIVANPGTLTGSIGVLSGKAIIRDALSKAGVGRETVSSGKHAEIFSTQRPFTDDECQRMEDWLDRVYADFTSKAAQDRKMDLADLQAVAKGRVWTGADAKDKGLVDVLGGLDDAVDLACAKAGVSRDRADVKVLPKVTPLDRLRPAESSESPAAATSIAGWSFEAGEGFEGLLRSAGVAPLGVLTMPVLWRIH